MTEAEWLACADPHRITGWIRQGGRYSDRRLRLFAAAYTRLYWDSLDDNRSRTAVEVAEAYGDGGATRIDLDQAARNARKASADAMEAGDYGWATFLAANIAVPGIGMWYAIVQEADFPATKAAFGVAAAATPESAARIVHCIFGNPFRPVPFDPRWRSEDAVGVARGIYEDRAFDRLPLLADALMDAGCDDEQVIGHCRGDGPHIRGCWVVDPVLGKE